MTNPDHRPDLEPPAAVPPAVGPGWRIAGYVLEQQIGAGGMAVVFRATDERLDRTVALKLLAPAFAADDDFRRRFIGESRAAAGIDDPHVIPVFEAGEASGILFIAMRYVRGGDVRTLLTAHGALPPARAMSIITQAAAALDAAHRCGLVHRDVKPANMLLDQHGGPGPAGDDHVYLSDFGLSKAAMHSTGLTKSGMFLGTLDYIAPEQIEGKAVDGRADQYALACAAFELLSGRPPFHRDDPMAVLYAQLHAPPPALAGLPAAVGDVFRTALSKAPAWRYPSCGEFAATLGRAIGVTAGAGTSGGGERAVLPARAAAAPAAALPDTGTAFVSPAGRESAPPPGQPAVRGRRLPRPVLAGAACGLLAAMIVAGVALVWPAGRHQGAGGPAPSGPSGQAGARGAGQRKAGPTSSPVRGAPRPEGTGRRALRSADYQLVGRLRPAAAGSISFVSWAADSGLAATSDKNGSTYLWDAATAAPEGPPLAGPGVVAYATAVSPDGTMVATGYADGTIRLWSTATARLLTTLPANASGPTPEINSLAFSPDGRALAAADGNGYLDLWSLGGGTQVSLRTRLRDPAGRGIYSVAVSKQGLLAAGDYLGNVYVWNLASLGQVGQFAVPGGSCSGSTICAAVSGLAFSGTGTVLAAGDLSGNADLWNTSGRMAVLGMASRGSPAIWGMSFSGQTLAIACRDKQLYLWQVTPGALTAAYQGSLTDPASGGDGIGAVGFSPDGRYLMTGDTNGSAYLWRFVSAGPGAAGQAWTDGRLTIAPRSLGAVGIGSTPAQASAAARVPLRPVGDSVWYPHGDMTSGLAITVGNGGTVSCVSASRQPGVPLVTTPQGFRLGGTLAQLRSVYGRSLQFVPAPAGGISPVPGYVVRFSGGNLAFWLAGGIVRRISAGPGVVPSTGCS